MIFGEINALASLVERIVKVFKPEKVQSPEELVSTRLVKLFEAHGVHRNQIPRTFGHGLTLVDMSSDITLLSKLDERILDDACQLFLVRREWLDGSDDKIYESLDFYNDLEGFEKFIDNLVGQGSSVNGVLLTPEKFAQNSNALLMLEEKVGEVGDRAFFRYYICNNWVFSYWKVRAYLAACVAMCWARNIYVRGLIVPKGLVESLADGDTLLGWNGKGLMALPGKRWHAEDMASLPEVFLNGLDPEINNFGLRAGLEEWLKLESQNLMYCGIEDVEARDRFVEQLKEYA